MIAAAVEARIQRRRARFLLAAPSAADFVATATSPSSIERAIVVPVADPEAPDDQPARKPQRRAARLGLGSRERLMSRSGRVIPTTARCHRKRWVALAACPPVFIRRRATNPLADEPPVPPSRASHGRSISFNIVEFTGSAALDAEPVWAASADAGLISQKKHWRGLSPPAHRGTRSKTWSAMTLRPFAVARYWHFQSLPSRRRPRTPKIKPLFVDADDPGSWPKGLEPISAAQLVRLVGPLAGLGQQPPDAEIERALYQAAFRDGRLCDGKARFVVAQSGTAAALVPLGEPSLLLVRPRWVVGDEDSRVQEQNRSGPVGLRSDGPPRVDCRARPFAARV